MKTRTIKTVTLNQREIEEAIGLWFDEKKFSETPEGLGTRDYISTIEWGPYDGITPITATLDVREDNR